MLYGVADNGLGAGASGGDTASGGAAESCPPNNLLSSNIPQIMFAPPTPEPSLRRRRSGEGSGDIMNNDIVASPASLSSTDSDEPLRWTSAPEVNKDLSLPVGECILPPPVVNTSQPSVSDSFYSAPNDQEDIDDDLTSPEWLDDSVMAECDEEIQRITETRPSQPPSPEPTFITIDDEEEEPSLGIGRRQKAILLGMNREEEEDEEEDDDGLSSQLLPPAKLPSSSSLDSHALLSRTANPAVVGAEGGSYVSLPSPSNSLRNQDDDDDDDITTEQFV